jgi:hypothetical protein
MAKPSIFPKKSCVWVFITPSRKFSTLGVANKTPFIGMSVVPHVVNSIVSTPVCDLKLFSYIQSVRHWCSDKKKIEMTSFSIVARVCIVSLIRALVEMWKALVCVTLCFSNSRTNSLHSCFDSLLYSCWEPWTKPFSTSLPVREAILGSDIWELIYVNQIQTLHTMYCFLCLGIFSRWTHSKHWFFSKSCVPTYDPCEVQIGCNGGFCDEQQWDPQ